MKTFPTVLTILLTSLILSSCAASMPESTSSSQPSVQNRIIAPDALFDHTWLWHDTADSHGIKVLPANPERYTLRFSRDGRLAVVADCNRGTGPYALTKDRLTIKPLAMTRVFCFGQSQADAFVAALMKVEEFALDAKVLKLKLKDGGAMTLSAEKVEK
jgi:heat shock protein HslJ